MATKGKKDQLVTIGSKPLVSVDPCLPEFEDHAFFSKKASAAKALLVKTGLPKAIAKKARS